MIEYRKMFNELHGTNLIMVNLNINIFLVLRKHHSISKNYMQLISYGQSNYRYFVFIVSIFYCSQLLMRQTHNYITMLSQYVDAILKIEK